MENGGGVELQKEEFCPLHSVVLHRGRSTKSRDVLRWSLFAGDEEKEEGGGEAFVEWKLCNKEALAFIAVITEFAQRATVRWWLDGWMECWLESIG